MNTFASYLGERVKAYPGLTGSRPFGSSGSWDTRAATAVTDFLRDVRPSVDTKFAGAGAAYEFRTVAHHDEATEISSFVWPQVRVGSPQPPRGEQRVVIGDRRHGDHDPAVPRQSTSSLRRVYKDGSIC